LTWEEFRHAFGGRRLAFSARATRVYTEIAFRPDDVLVFGGETRGLPAMLQEELAPELYRIPITSAHVRSLNLANAVAIVVYEALRQLGSRARDSPA
jgi:tRNA (cytidine/uridine-2'-O-)-methyltransferase